MQRARRSLAKEGGDSGDVLLAEIEYAPTITNPKKILCVGLNYKAHAEETNSDAPKEPIVFNKSPNWILNRPPQAQVLTAVSSSLFFLKMVFLFK